MEKNEVYLQHVIKVHEYLFNFFARTDKDTFDAIKRYMISEQRAAMDARNPKYLNVTPEQLVNEVYGQCSLRPEEDNLDEVLMNWVAKIYVLLQFQTEYSSMEIVNRVRPEWLYSNYSFLHEASDANSVEKIIETFWTDDKLKSGNIIGFHSEQKQYGFLSNWYLSGFSVGDTYFTSVEQWIMYNKAILFNNDEIADRILQEIKPEVIKKLGRKVTGFIEADWIAKRYEILLHGLRAKFSQSNELKKMLLATDDCILVEFSKIDRIYGVGIWDKSPNRFNQTYWRGQNLLGKALMQVRAEMQATVV